MYDRSPVIMIERHAGQLPAPSMHERGVNAVATEQELGVGDSRASGDEGRKQAWK